jgi:hypothetical protein
MSFLLFYSTAKLAILIDLAVIELKAHFGFLKKLTI